MKKDHYQLHVNITDEVKKIVWKDKVVFPATYGKVYAQMAKKHGAELSPSQLLNKEMLDEKVVRHIISLTQYTDDALDAMKSNNQQKLERVIEETKKLRQEIDELQALVYKDTLTNCFNRKWFEDKYLDADKSSLSKGGVLVFIDLNRLKRINDDYGHVVGDKVIRYLALKLQEITPSVVRFGGDEFLLLFEHSDPDREQKMLEAYNFFKKTKFKAENNEFKATFAYGLSEFKKGDALNAVLDDADKKMYKFKEGNRE